MPKRIFVFGSNLAGRHGAGSAKEAVRRHGAQYGVGKGRTGDAYAIPTKDVYLRTLPLYKIEVEVHEFLRYARANPALIFDVVAIGTGLAGYNHAQIAPFFAGRPPNVNLPKEWLPYLETA